MRWQNCTPHTEHIRRNTPTSPASQKGGASPPTPAAMQLADGESPLRQSQTRRSTSKTYLGAVVAAISFGWQHVMLELCKRGRLINKMCENVRKYAKSLPLAPPLPMKAHSKLPNARICHQISRGSQFHTVQHPPQASGGKLSIRRPADRQKHSQAVQRGGCLACRERARAAPGPSSFCFFRPPHSPG